MGSPLLVAEFVTKNTQTVCYCLPVCLPACPSDCVIDCLPDYLTDWLTVSLSSRCTAEGNRILKIRNVFWRAQKEFNIACNHGGRSWSGPDPKGGGGAPPPRPRLQTPKMLYRTMGFVGARGARDFVLGIWQGEILVFDPMCLYSK